MFVAYELTMGRRVRRSEAEGMELKGEYTVQCRSEVPGTGDR